MRNDERQAGEAGIVSAGTGPTAERLVLGGHVLHIERTATGGVLRLLNTDGGRPLEIEVTPQGPILRFGAPLALAVDGALSIDADSVLIRARTDISLISQGSITMHAEGRFQTTARTHDIRANLGSVNITANDDVIVDGERIFFNCS
jgi:hypothetical protein